MRNILSKPFRSRLQSKYTPISNSVSSGKDGTYADPFVGAPTSFQQRLSELSMLESDTVKYEKQRKIKRKSKQQDKDS